MGALCALFPLHNFLLLLFPFFRSQPRAARRGQGVPCRRHNVPAPLSQGPGPRVTGTACSASSRVLLAPQLRGGRPGRAGPGHIGGET